MSKLRGVEKLSVLVEIVMFCFRLFFYVVALIDLYLEKGTIDHFYLVMIWLIAAMVVPICFWIPHLFKKSLYYCFAELLLNGSLTIYVMHTTNSYTALFIISALTISYHLEKRYYWMIAIMAFFPFLEFILKGISVENENPFFYLFNHWFLLMIGLGFNLIIKAYKNTENLNRVIEEQNQTLVQYAKQIEALTLVEERNRMARDLHDTLGHSFIAYILGLDAVLYLMDSNTSKAKKKIEELRNYASVNLDQIRETIHEIGTETDISLTSNFSAIINEFSEYTNTGVSFEIVGEEYVLQHSMRMALLRCLQEGLTNAKWHGQSTDIAIILSFFDHEVELMIKEKWPQIKVIILTSYKDVDYVVSALANGAEGYLLKSLHPRSLASSIRLVHSGGTLITKEMAASLINNQVHKEETVLSVNNGDRLQNLTQLYGLSEREVEVLKLLAKGLRNNDISERLFLSGGTVKNYISNIYAKLEVKGRREATDKAKNEGFV